MMDQHNHAHVDIIPGGGLRHLFNINSTNTNPEMLDTERIQPVVEMSMGGKLKLNDNVNYRRKAVLYTLVGDAPSLLLPILSYGNAVGTTDLVFDVGYNFRVISFAIDIYIPDDAYRTARSSRILKSELLLNVNVVGGGGNYVRIHEGSNTIYTPNPFPVSGYALQLSARDLIVPAGCSLEWGIRGNCKPSPDANYFPLDDGMVFEGSIAGLQVPIGAPIPSFWG